MIQLVKQVCVRVRKSGSSYLGPIPNCGASNSLSDCQHILSGFQQCHPHQNPCYHVAPVCSDTASVQQGVKCAILGSADLSITSPEHVCGLTEHEYTRVPTLPSAILRLSSSSYHLSMCKWITDGAVHTRVATIPSAILRLSSSSCCSLRASSLGNAMSSFASCICHSGLSPTSIPNASRLLTCTSVLLDCSVLAKPFRTPYRQHAL